jgi:glycerol-3-phosphate dehydrogenase
VSRLLCPGNSNRGTDHEVLERFTGLITRGLSEMTRIGVAYGANPLTFLSMAGVGDLFLTCSSLTSRNYTVGVRLGRGESLEEVLNTLGSVAEGVTTAKGLKAIADNLDVPAPLANAVIELSFHVVSWADVE